MHFCTRQECQSKPPNMFLMPKISAPFCPYCIVWSVSHLSMKGPSPRVFPWWFKASYPLHHLWVDAFCCCHKHVQEVSVISCCSFWQIIQRKLHECQWDLQPKKLLQDFQIFSQNSFSGQIPKNVCAAPAGLELFLETLLGIVKVQRKIHCRCYYECSFENLDMQWNY